MGTNHIIQITLILTGIFIHRIACSQTSSEFIEDYMNKYFDTDIEDQNLFENLLENYLHPLDINKGNFEDFERLAIFSESEIRLIIQYRIEAKKIFSVYELQVIEGIPLHKIEMALPFLTVGGVNQEKNILQSILSKDNTYLLLKSDRQIQENSSYPGSPYKFTGRYRSARSGDYSFGFLFEKDRGETIAFNPKSGFYGFDFYSFHLAFYNRGFVKSFMLGDFKIQSGQGLVFSSGLFSARNIDPVLSTKRSQLNFTPYTSSGESGFFRGMGITMSLSTKTDLSIFYSRKLRDAKVYATSSQTYFQAFSNSGLHRTSSELANRNTLLETNSGIIFTTQVIQGLKIGANFNYTTFNIPIYPGEEVEKIFSIQGTSHGTGSLFIDFRKNNYTIFKELAIDYNGKSAIIGGVLFNISKTMDMAMHLRNYQPGYTGFYARGEGKNAGNTNELGLYYGFNAQLFPRIKFSGYFDSYRFYWLKHNIPSPSYGREFMYKLESKLA
ncbi:MAG: helix-hairpin-helix domain-containing protein, partial [Cyclobacteriaceae bacterium]|nr:helix-hairpin-helix domain-containing protein [Cyclobacteriaceae bacterium]